MSGDVDVVVPEWIIPAIAGPLAVGAFVLLVRVVLRGVFRLFVRPRISIRHTVGNKCEGDGQVSPFFPTRRVSLWVQSSADVHVDFITFRRICKYQRHCLLFRFFIKVGVLGDQRWCSFAKVNDCVFESHGFVKPSDAEKVKIETTVANEGELALRPSMGTMIGGRWTSLDVPFILSCERPHTLTVTLDYGVDLRHRSGILRNLDAFLSLAGMKNSHVFCTTKRVDIDWGTHVQKRAEPAADGSGIPEFKAGEIYVGSSYSGFGWVSRAKELTSCLNSCIATCISKDPRPTETPAWEVMESMRRKMPDVLISVELPSSGVYWSLPAEATKELLGCWSFCRQFCDEFLGCTNYVGLCKLFMEYSVFFPQLLADSHAYLCFKGRSTRMEFIHWLERKGQSGILSLGRFAVTQWKVWCSSRKACKVLRRRTDRQADTVIRLRRA